MEFIDNFYCAVAYEYLHLAYSFNCAQGFTSYRMIISRLRKNGKPINKIKVECFNGGAFVTITIVDNRNVFSSGHYRKHRPINFRLLGQKIATLVNSGIYPSFYEIIAEGYKDTYNRFVHEKDLERKMVELAAHYKELTYKKVM